MDKLLERLIEISWKSGAFRVLLYALFLSCALAIFNPFNLNSILGVDEQFSEYRFILVLVFYAVGFFVVLEALIKLALFMKKIGSSIRLACNKRIETAKILKAEISRDALLLLNVICSQEPDPLDLIPEDPVVRELRKNDLVRGNQFGGRAGPTQPFWLTEAGRTKITQTPSDFLDSFPDGYPRLIMKRVTGE